jgi:glycosyltransferase involved in cell wall biosynthesis
MVRDETPAAPPAAPQDAPRAPARRAARRVVHLVHNFPPEFRGGTESYLARLVPLQRAQGLDVTVVCGSETRREGEARREEFAGAPVFRVFRRPDEPFAVDFRPAQPRAVVAKLVRELAPDVLHLHHWFNLGDDLLAQLAPIPAVATFHDSYAGCVRFFFLRPDGFFCGSDLPVPLERCVECVRPEDGHAALHERLAARRARFAAEVARLRFAFAPSAAHAETIVRAGIVPRELMHALPIGLPAEEIAQLARAGGHRPAPGRLRLVCFGNLNLLKGLDLVFDAMRPLVERGVELHLFGVPLAAEAADLERRAAGLPVTWHGDYDLADFAIRAADLDLAVFPSRAHETYSMVLEEAIAMRLPVVVSDRGAPPRRVAGFGRIVRVEDARELQATLAELLDHPERLAAMRAALPPPHRLDDHARALRGFYDAALDPVARGPAP